MGDRMAGETGDLVDRRRSGSGLSRRGFGIRLRDCACKLAHPDGLRAKDDDSDSAPRPPDVAAADHQICRNEDAHQMGKGHEAEENAGNA